MKTFKMIYPKKSLSKKDKLFNWIFYSLHWKIRSFLHSINSLSQWFLTIWKDRHWDDSYIYRILSKKIELQREYINKRNRFVGVESCVFWMTVALNLIERELDEYYTLEEYDYLKLDFKFHPVELNGKTVYEMEEIVKEDRCKEYVDKNKLTAKKIKQRKTLQYIPKDIDVNLLTDRKLAFYVAHEKQLKCKKLLFKILEEHLNKWWD